MKKWEDQIRPKMCAKQMHFVLLISRYLEVDLGTKNRADLKEVSSQIRCIDYEYIITLMRA